MTENYKRAKEFYERKKGRLFASYKEGKEFFDEVLEKYDYKKGYYLGSGVNLNKLAHSHFLSEDNDKAGIVDVYVPIKDTYGHTAIIGTTRRGKTRLQMALVRQMILNGENVFLTEPKGSVGQEVISWILEFLEEAGQLEAFKYISPAFPAYSLPFNSFFGMDDESIASSVANTIQAKETFYADIGYDITMAICLALRFLEEIKDKQEVECAIKREYNKIFSSSFLQDPLAEILNATMDTDLSVDLATMIQKGKKGEKSVKKPPFRSLITVADIAYYASPNGLSELKELVKSVSDEDIKLTITMDKHNEFKTQKEKQAKVKRTIELKKDALKNLQSQLDKPKDYFNKVATSYKLILDKLSTGKLGELLCSVKINPLLDLLKNGENQTVVVMQPAPLMFKEASVGLMRLVSSMLMNWFGRVGMSGRSFTRTLNFVVDEGGAVLTKEMVELLNKGGALKLKITIGTQSFGDYLTALGAEWAGVALDNMNVKIYFAVNDDMSRQKVSSLFGSTKQAKSSFGNSGIDMRGQVNYQAEELVLSSHISELPRQTFLYQNADSKFLVKAPYLHDANNFVKMPYLDMENEIDRYYKDILKEALRWEKELNL